MGTRGAYGFHRNGELKVTYNHFDSYPEGLGQGVLEFVRLRTLAQLNAGFDRIRVVDEGSKPTAEDIEHARKCGTLDLSVSGQSENDWYCLLRGAQGNLGAAVEMGIMTDASSFLKDSLFCEWAYLINLDDGTLDIYRGYCRVPPTDGLFAGAEPSSPRPEAPSAGKYYPVNRIGRFKLDDLPECLPDYCEDEE